MLIYNVGPVILFAKYFKNNKFTFFVVWSMNTALRENPIWRRQYTGVIETQEDN